MRRSAGGETAAVELALEDDTAIEAAEFEGWGFIRTGVIGG